MKAITITKETEPVQLKEVPTPVPSEGECLIRVKAAALNRRDQWVREGKYPGITYGIILGSDGCGVVAQGPDKWIGKEVIINPNVNWGDDPEVQSANYSVLGMPTDGTLAEYVKVPIDRLHQKPSGLDNIASSALPLAALTAFRVTFTKGKVTQGSKVLITGAGGGVSQFALAFAIARGADVYVTSGSEEKISKAISMGAIAGFNYHDEEWHRQADEAVRGFDTIIDSAGGSELNHYLKIIRPAGRVVCYGSTIGYPEKLDIFRLFWSQVQLLGSTMGNDDEFSQMLAFVDQHRIQPTIDQVFTLDNYLQAFDRFNAPNHFGKIVISFS